MNLNISTKGFPVWPLHYDHSSHITILPQALCQSLQTDINDEEHCLLRQTL